MPVQPSLFPDPPPPLTHSAPAERRDVSAVTPAPIWLQRISLLMLVLFCIYLGVLMAILPWWTRVWDHNLFLEAHPRLWDILHLGAVRGLISGLGLLDIWIGLSEAIHYREDK